MIHKFTPEELAERQARAVKKIEQLGKDIMNEAHEIGELHRQHKAKKEAIDLNDSDTQWALVCEAVGDNTYWEE